MPKFLRKLFTPSLRDQLEVGVKEALRRYADRRVAPDLRVYVTTDLVPDGIDPELWARDERDHLLAFAQQWAQDNGIGRAGLDLEVVLLDTKREFAFVKPIGLEAPAPEEAGKPISPGRPAPPPPQPGVTLSIVESPERREPIVVRDEMILGRRAEPGVTAMGDRYMSARHARLRVRGSGLEVTDLDSKNRTYLNDEPLPPNEPRPAGPGDLLRMGGTVLRVEG